MSRPLGSKNKKNINSSVSDNNPLWKKEWKGMPKFYIPTRNTLMRNNFDISDMIYYNTHTPTSVYPKYPIYIISKGRWESRLTSKALEKLNIPYHIVIEPQEYDNYAAVIDKSKILVLPFSNLGQGSIPARNWVWEHSLKQGTKRHWILDDNISGFGTQKYGRRIKTNCGDFFSYCENFVDRYKNIALAGIRYRFHHNYVKSPYLLNTRIYSCIIIQNNIPYRWRGTYNEDSDLSIRVLKNQWCTLLFIWCYCDKVGTMTIPGGNTENLYKDNGRLKMAQSLQQQHPDIVKIVHKYGRYQHSVNYKIFANNKLIKTPGINNYGMKLANIKDKK